MADGTDFTFAQVFGKHDGRGGRRCKNFRDGQFELDEQGNLHIQAKDGNAVYNWRYWESIKTEDQIEEQRADF